VSERLAASQLQGDKFNCYVILLRKIFQSKRKEVMIERKKQFWRPKSRWQVLIVDLKKTDCDFIDWIHLSR
jgi:hypothetical protein